jgi:hypothetical protein
MAVQRLTFEKRKVILKGYWKFQNDNKVQMQWQCEFVTEPPTRVTIGCILDKFEVKGMAQDVHKQRSGKLHTITSPASSAVVLQELT